MRGLITTLAILLAVVVLVAMFMANQNETAPISGADSEPASASALDTPTGDPRDAIPAEPASDTATDTVENAANTIAEEAVSAAETIAETAQPEAEAAPAEAIETSDSELASVSGSAATTQAAATPITLKALPAAKPDSATIGSNDAESDFKLKITFTPYGAGIQQITTTDYMTKVDGDTPYTILSPFATESYTVYPFAAWSILINGQALDLQTAAFDLAHSDPTSATYELIIADANDAPLAKISRKFYFGDEPYDLRCDQRIDNLSGQPLDIQWRQYTVGDLAEDKGSYLADQRRVAVGNYDLDYDSDPNTQEPLRRFVYAQDNVQMRSSVVSQTEEGKRPFWPLSGMDASDEFVWLATTNRYFTVAIHPPAEVTEEATTIKPWFDPENGSFASVDSLLFGGYDAEGDDQRILVFTMHSRPLTIAPGSTKELDFAVFAGPRDKSLLHVEPYKSLQFPDLIVYNLGGMCAMCTFQWLAKGLLGFLEFLHDYVVFDWGFAIIMLVIMVRLILHPITKKAQVNMMKMGKQMAALQPDLEKLKKKYKDDQQTLNTEMMKLYREAGVNPANMFGCLPMFLQMPIWIALYAMLYFAIELRHEPAFFGFFQVISSGAWPFLGDLSQQDNFIQIYAEPVKINLWFINWNFQSINIIPLLMAVVFYINQKLMTPRQPTSRPPSSRRS